MKLPPAAGGDKSRRHIGLIGFGAIAQDLYNLLRAPSRPATKLTVLLRPDSHSRAKVPPDCAVVHSLAALIAAAPEVVVEAAGQAAAAALVPGLLEASIPVVLSAVGCLAKERVMTAFQRSAATGGTWLEIPSGAVGGIDYICAARSAGAISISYTSRKPAAAWADELTKRGLAPEGLDDEVVLYEGEAAEAARLFPQNLNVAATLAIAGSGMAATRVRVVADRRVSRNTHEIEVESAAGRAVLRFENAPAAANPKTSAVTAPAILYALDQALFR